MWASGPAIQPVSNKDLKHLHTIFGLRMHPLLGYVRPHNGLDFTAPAGCPIYATGDGPLALHNIQLLWKCGLHRSWLSISNTVWTHDKVYCN
jgi:hypothetical protein